MFVKNYSLRIVVMKKLLTTTLLFCLISFNNSMAQEVFIEPGIFVNMMDSANIKHDGDTGVLRSNDLSYALKFGVHYGHYEFGIESEVYNFAAHLKSSDSGDYSHDMQIAYNSIFFGYEFKERHIFYISLSSRPYVEYDGRSYHEKHPVLSAEYSYHLKDWVSVNAKIETASKLEQSGTSDEYLQFGNLLLIGFSFPLIAN